MNNLALFHFSWEVYTHTQSSLTATKDPHQGPGLVCGGRYFLVALCCPRYCNILAAREETARQCSSDHPNNLGSYIYASKAAAIFNPKILQALGSLRL
mmetsp:Transcript_22242/g.31296  ORF Transcript_22242/g.31296 Transcript_22242/m.31296 type:complete len:98 (-) Transcript_22242:908-1201(-)